VTFWNLQPDDDHDFALGAPDLNILMYVLDELRESPCS
jgi:hypothetical protein